MSTENDAKILKLREQIEAKEVELRKASNKFSPVTTCSIDLDGVRLNLNVLNANELRYLYIKLHNLQKGEQELGFDILLCGFPLEDWIKDVSAKLAIATYSTEMKQLAMMKTKLQTLLSDEKQTEMALDEIANLLK